MVSPEYDDVCPKFGCLSPFVILQDLKTVMWIRKTGQAYSIPHLQFARVHICSHWLRLCLLSRSRAHLGSVPLLWHCHYCFDSLQPQAGADQLQPAAPGTQTADMGRRQRVRNMFNEVYEV